MFLVGIRNIIELRFCLIWIKPQLWDINVNETAINDKMTKRLKNVYFLYSNFDILLVMILPFVTLWWPLVRIDWQLNKTNWNKAFNHLHQTFTQSSIVQVSKQKDTIQYKFQKKILPKNLFKNRCKILLWQNIQGI